MEKQDYFQNRDYINSKKIINLLKSLPECCTSFVIGIESKTSVLTRLNYLLDIKTFFTYLTNENRYFMGKDLFNLSTAELNNIKSVDIERFLYWINNYEVNGRLYSNNDKAKARKLSSLRSFFKYLYKKDFINSNEISKVDMPKIHDKEIIRLEVDEVVKVLNEIEEPTNLTKRQKAFNKGTYIRDLAIMSLFLGTGIRISECVGLDIDDIDFEINGFKITRKGGNKVILYFSDEVAVALKDYMKERLFKKDVDENEKALFLSLQKKRISPRAVENLVKKYSKSAIPLKSISPHKLRSTYGTNLYRETKDIYIVANVLGHKDVNTTKKHYAAISEDMRRSVIEKVKLRRD